MFISCYSYIGIYGVNKLFITLSVERNDVLPVLILDTDGRIWYTCKLDMAFFTVPYLITTIIIAET